MGALERRVTQAKRPPRFTTGDWVEIDIDPEDLEAAGWRYVGKDDKPGATTEQAVDIVRRWHDRAHDGPWMWCDHELCDELRGRETHA